MVQLEEVQNY